MVSHPFEVFVTALAFARLAFAMAVAAFVAAFAAWFVAAAGFAAGLVAVATTTFATATAFAPATIASGGVSTLTITIGNPNAGPITVTSVTDTFPASLTGVTWTCVGAGGGIELPFGGTGKSGHGRSSRCPIRRRRRW